jgi:hypothetical protein
LEYNCEDFRSADLRVLLHHIYEYRKGLRDMVLHTMSSADRQKAEYILKQKNICFHTRTVSRNKINIFFGHEECVDVVRSFGDKSLSEYTPEQDYILGIMLGYNRKEQGKRYIRRLKMWKERHDIMMKSFSIN